MKVSRFTLLELILVVLILGLISSSALLVVDTQDNQLRYDETKRRLEQINYALIGNERSSTTNVISGYLADMGDTPSQIEDLISKPAGASDWAYNSILGFGSGWRGPYIANFDTNFRDGWGFTFKGDDDNDWDGFESSGALNITSHGANGSSGGSDYDRDITLGIPEANYKKNSPINFSITLVNETGSDTPPEKFQLLVLYPDDSLPTDFDSDLWADVDPKFICQEDPEISIVDGSSQTLLFTLNESLIYRQVRLLLIKPDEAGTSIKDKIASEEDVYDHVYIYPYSNTNPTYTFRLK